MATVLIGVETFNVFLYFDKNDRVIRINGHLLQVESSSSSFVLVDHPLKIYDVSQLFFIYCDYT